MKSYLFAITLALAFVGAQAELFAQQQGMPPSPEPHLSGQVTMGEVILRWDDCTNETSYDVYRNTDITTSGDKSAYSVLASTDVDVTMYTDSAVTNETKYWYFIRAINNDGHTDSNIIEVYVVQDYNIDKTAGGSSHSGYCYIDSARNGSGLGAILVAALALLVSVALVARFAKRGSSVIS